MKRTWEKKWTLFVGLILCLSLFRAEGARAQADGVTFPETGKTVKGIFLQHWSYSGGTSTYGLPISNELQETSPIDGKTYTMQYFERAVFESHLDNEAPYNVLLSLLGTLMYKQKYPNGAAGQMASNTPDSRFFPETNKHLGCQFLDYWQKNGGLIRFGYPITDEMIETAADGSAVRVQYFQRAVLMYDEVAIAHFASERGYVMAPAVGTARFGEKYKGQAVSLPTPRPAATAIGECLPTPHGPSISDQIDDPPVRASVGKGLVVTGTVKSSAGCKPIANATVIYWLAGSDGEYDSDHLGKVVTDSTGRYRFETNFPGFYGAGGPHIHLYMSGPGHRGIELEIFAACGQTEGTYDVVLVPGQ
jgi:hypothetical protein